MSLGSSYCVILSLKCSWNWNMFKCFIVESNGSMGVLNRQLLCLIHQEKKKNMVMKECSCFRKDESIFFSLLKMYLSHPANKAGRSKWSHFAAQNLCYF